MGAPAVPDAFEMSTISLYVPDRTITVSPGTVRSTASLIVHRGWFEVPGPESEQFEWFLATKIVVAAAAGRAVASANPTPATTAVNNCNVLRPHRRVSTIVPPTDPRYVPQQHAAERQR